MSRHNDYYPDEFHDRRYYEPEQEPPRRGHSTGAMSVVAIVSVLGGFLGGAVYGQRVSGFLGLDKSSPSSPATRASTQPSVSKEPTRETSPSATSSPETTPTSRTSTQMLKRIVFIDAGHGGSVKVVIDKETGLRDSSSTNSPEREEMFKAALKVKEILASKGVESVIGKESATDTMTHRERTEAARAADADLAISLHSDHTQQHDRFQAVYPQIVDQFRVSENGNRVEFKDSQTACESQAYTKLIAAAREEAQGRKVRIDQLNFNGRESLAAGNIALVALFAQANSKQGKVGIPWVYNEIGGKTSSSITKPLPDTELENYAQGIANGVLQSISEMDAIEKQCSP